MEFLHSIVQAHSVAISAGILLIAYFFIALEKSRKLLLHFWVPQSQLFWDWLARLSH